MRTAFLVLNHRPPAQLLRLLRTLRSGDRDAPLVVHHDRFRSNFNESALEPLGSAHLLTSDVPVKWGDFSIVDVYWQSLAWMLEHVEFDWVVVLSAQDYPIKPLRALEDMLSQSDADVFMHAEKIDDIAYGRGRWERRRRYLYQYRDRPAAPVPAHAGVLHRVGHLTQEFVFASLNILQPYVHFYKLPDGLPRCVGVRARSTPFSATFPCWYGPDRSTLSHRAAEVVVATSRRRPEYVAYYRKTMLPDESATATIVCNAPELKIEPRDLHHIRWTRARSGHPDVFGVADLPELLASPCYFARKFDIAQDIDVLDRLDQAIMPDQSQLDATTPVVESPD